MHEMQRYKVLNYPLRLSELRVLTPSLPSISSWTQLIYRAAMAFPPFSHVVPPSLRHLVCVSCPAAITSQFPPLPPSSQTSLILISPATVAVAKSANAAAKGDEHCCKGRPLCCYNGHLLELQPTGGSSASCRRYKCMCIYEVQPATSST